MDQTDQLEIVTDAAQALKRVVDVILVGQVGEQPIEEHDSLGPLQGCFLFFPSAIEGCCPSDGEFGLLDQPHHGQRGSLSRGESTIREGHFFHAADRGMSKIHFGLDWVVIFVPRREDPPVDRVMDQLLVVGSPTIDFIVEHKGRPLSERTFLVLDLREQLADNPFNLLLVRHGCFNMEAGLRVLFHDAIENVEA